MRATIVEFVLFTLAPLFTLGAAFVYCAIRLSDTWDVRILPLLALLGLMSLHQTVEVSQFITGSRVEPVSRSAETFESGVNVLASVGSYYVLEQVDDLRSTRAELRASNGVLKERSAMVSVLNRVLRHNVRNEVNVIAGRIANAAARVDDERVGRELEIAEKQALALARISDRTSRITRLLDDERSELVTLQLCDSLEQSLARVEPERQAASVNIRGADGATPEVRVHSLLPLMIADVVEDILAINDGPVNVQVTVETIDASNDGTTEQVQIVINDDARGLPKPDLSVLDNDTELPLEHAEGISLWCLKWVVERSDGTVHEGGSDSTVRIRLPRVDGK